MTGIIFSKLKQKLIFSIFPPPYRFYQVLIVILGDTKYIILDNIRIIGAWN